MSEINRELDAAWEKSLVWCSEKQRALGFEGDTIPHLYRLQGLFEEYLWAHAPEATEHWDTIPLIIEFVPSHPDKDWRWQIEWVERDAYGYGEHIEAGHGSSLIGALANAVLKVEVKTEEVI